MWGIGAGGTKLDDDFLQCTTPVLEAVKVVPGFKREHKTFFNQLVATTANALEFRKVGKSSENDENSWKDDEPTQADIDDCVRFGNGDPIPLDFLIDAKRICEENAIDILWQKGDVALISNYLMMHSRRPWSGPEGTRKLLASLIAEENCTSFGKTLVVM
jgi:Taurine catabolism dioxygenase TauD, TfdA family